MSRRPPRRRVVRPLHALTARTSCVPAGPHRSAARPRLVGPGLVALALAATLIPSACTRRDRAIVIDGAFDDWEGVMASVEDPLDAEGAAVDLGAVHVAHDAHHLYFAFDVGREVNAQSLDGTLSILLDADGRADSGSEVNGLPGVDAIVELSPRTGPGAAPVEGVGIVRLHDADRRERRSPYDLGIVFSPTYAATRFELRLDRPVAARDGGGAARLRAKLVFTDASGRVRDETGIIRYALSGGGRHDAGDGVAEAGPPVDPLHRAPATALRVMSWNVSRDGITERAAYFRRVLRAVRADVVLLDELSDQLTEARLMTLLQDTGPPGRAAPRVGRGGGGGGPRRHELEAAEPVALVRYPESARDEFAPLIGRDFDGNSVSVVGALVTVGGRRVLAAALDAKCCGRAGSAEDALRQIEARAVHDALRAALDAYRPAAVIVAGDLNLVGSRAPLDLLRAGLDVGGGALAIVEALGPEGRSNATWRDRESPFTPGRLDYQLFSGSVLAVDRALVVNVDGLALEVRERYALRGLEGDTGFDHLPIVTDFSWR